MTHEERMAITEAFSQLHEASLRQFAEHMLKNFRGEVDVVSGKLDRLRERVEQLEKSAVENAPQRVEAGKLTVTAITGGERIVLDDPADIVEFEKGESWP